LQVYTANETADQNVWFDDFKVTFTPQLIVQENHYYPFGLELSGINKENKPEHKFTFQGQEEQKEFGLNWSSFKWRNADVAIGRFHSVDPLAEDYLYNSVYAFSENKVTNHVELEGLESVSATALNYAQMGLNAWDRAVNWFTGGIRKMGQGIKDYQQSQIQKNDEGYVEHVPEGARRKMDFVRENKAKAKMAEGMLQHYGTHHDAMGFVMGALEGGAIPGALKKASGKAASNAIYIPGLRRGPGAKVAEDAAEKGSSEWTRVGRWMNDDEYTKMKDTGLVQEGGGGLTFSATTGPNAYRKQTYKGNVYVEYDVPTNSLLPGGEPGWVKNIGPSAPKSQQYLLKKQGGKMLPKWRNLSEVLEVKK